MFSLPLPHTFCSSISQDQIRRWALLWFYAVLQNLRDETRPLEAAAEMLSERELALWLKAPKPRVLAATKMAQLAARCNMQNAEVRGGQREGAGSRTQLHIYMMLRSQLHSSWKHIHVTAVSPYIPYHTIPLADQ